MGRGILSGLIWGSIISVAVLGAVSQLTPLPEQVSEAQEDVASAAEPAQPEAVPEPEEAAPEDGAEASSDPAAEQTATVSGTGQDETAPAPAPVSPLMESPEAESVPEPAEDPAASAQTARTVEAPSTGVELPAGSEFRKALPETEAELPGSAGAPTASHTPMAPPPEAEDGTTGFAFDPAPRPATPGMSVTAPAAPAADGTDTAAVAIPPELAATPQSPAAPAPQAIDAGDTALDSGISDGFPPPIRPETAQPETVTATADAREQINGGAPEATLAPGGAEAVATAIAETVTAGAVDRAGSVASETAPAAEAESLASLPSQAGDAAPVPVPDAPAVTDHATNGGTSAETAIQGGTAAMSADTPPEVSDLAPRVPPVQGPTDSAQAVTGRTQSSEAAQAMPETAEPRPAQPAATAEADRLDGSELASAPTTGLGERVRPLTERTAASARLPQIGATRSDTTEAVVEEPAPEARDADAPRLDALARNASAFENSDGKPLFSVILIDDGSGGIDRSVLATFTFPVTFAIDPTRPDAKQAAEELSDAGFEVVALATGLPDGATASDVETTLEAHLAQIPQAVAVMDVAQGGLAAQRQLAEQALTFAARDGHGLIGWSGGLGPLEAAARKGDAPVALVYRALDNEDENSTRIGRYLDRAAFKAAQDGAVIMVGRARPETVTALFEWALDSKSGQVALAPVSAVLRRR